eukprot:648512-Amphidinium_carterae.1
MRRIGQRECYTSCATCLVTDRALQELCSPESHQLCHSRLVYKEPPSKVVRSYFGRWNGTATGAFALGHQTTCTIMTP